MLARGAIAILLIASGAVSARAEDAAPAMRAPFAVDGWYAGGHLGQAWGSSAWTARGADETLRGNFDYFDPYSLAKGTGSYFAGFQAGWQRVLSDRTLFGFEADLSFPNTIQGTDIVASPRGGLATYQELVQYSGTVRGKLGHAFDGFQLYGTAGLAWSYDLVSRTQVSGAPATGWALPGTTAGDRFTRLGWSAGAGIDIPLTESWRASLEYVVARYGEHTSAFPSAGQRFSSDMTMQDIRFGLDYRIGAAGMGIIPDSLAGGSVSGDDKAFGRSTGTGGGQAGDWFAIHGQATFVEQYDPRFRSPYRGPNSLVPGQWRETADATFYGGVRLWPGAELWLDTEIDQGFGLSNTLGVAGFTSGEAYKVGSQYPYARIPRTFVRQNIDLGGASEDTEAGLNQFASTHTADHLVLTAGKFAVTDIFDGNKFAHDARTDFLNWSMIDAGSFDYAADAWGFTYGAAAEWYKGDWTVRAGLFDLSKVPNSTELDPTFQQFQAVLELERRFELFGQKGRAMVTGFLSRARMGTFTDAVRLAAATGEPADTGLVRQYRSRTGVSFNLEQDVATNIGVFVRAGTADGRVEPYEFTDIDRSVSGGVSLKGALWGLPGHEVGIGGVLNGISGEHHEYLAAGGLGILVGDGRLPHPGTEKIFETYYSLPLSKWLLSLDYQYVANPAYNTDRGPVSVIGTRARIFF